MDTKICEEKNKFSCSYCKKNYVRKSAYNNHLLNCKLARFNDFQTSNNNSSSSCNSSCSSINGDIDITTGTSSHNSDIKESDKILKKDININNLFSMIIMLNNKYEKLESQYNELKKYVNITKNKINILDYLNENFKQEYLNVGIGLSGNNINKFLDELIIDIDMLNKIFKFDYVDGILNILIEYIEKTRVKDLLIPIKCFNNKENVLYIFDGEKWIVMDDIYLRKFIKSFDKKLLVQFLQWKIDTEKTIDSEIFGEVYINNMKKVIGGNFEKKNKELMIKNKLFKYLKVDLKSIVQYEFV